jgi:transcriptional regulator of heat shock response
LSPEFADLAVCSNIFSLIEEVDKMQELFFTRTISGSPIDVLFGEEFGWSGFSPVGIVTTHFDVKGKHAALGVIGPVALRYSTVIPTLRYFRNMIMEIAGA